MPYPQVKEGQGCTILCGTTSWSAELIDIQVVGQKFEKLDVTKLSSVGYKEYIQSSLADPGELDIKYHFNPDNQYPVTTTGESITILYPPVGTATGATQQSRTLFNAFVVEANKHSVATGKIMEGSMKLCLTGGQTHTTSA